MHGVWVDREDSAIAWTVTHSSISCTCRYGNLSEWISDNGLSIVKSEEIGINYGIYLDGVTFGFVDQNHDGTEMAYAVEVEVENVGYNECLGEHPTIPSTEMDGLALKQ